MLLAILGATPPPVCEPGVNMPQGDLPGMPLATADASACSQLCSQNDNCTLFSWHAAGCSYYTESCKEKGGCCWLKSVEVAGAAPQVNNCSCSGYVRLPKTSFVPRGTPAKDAKNVLYILVSRQRPEPITSEPIAQSLL